MKRQGRNKKRIILGLTGSFGSGKTTVARIFKSFGAGIIDADRIAHNTLCSETPIYNKIINVFGKGVLMRSGRIDRNKLAKVVFNDKNLLKKLNKIMHPEVIRIIKERMETSRCRVIVLDAPLLIEAGLEKIVDRLIVVAIRPERQVERMRRKFGFNRMDILKRINAQIPLCDKICRADFVIDNNGTINETKRQVEYIRRLLWKN